MMLGNIPELYEYNDSKKYPHMLYVPFKFWFCNFFNESLPIISLRYTDVNITVNVKPLNEVAYWNDDNDIYFEKTPTLN